MENKLHQFFSENNFDFYEPSHNHLSRFEQKLDPTKKKSVLSWKWLSVAASVILIFGFWLGNNYQKQQIDLADISPKMKEAQLYFVSSIRQELKTLKENRNLKTEKIVEQAIEALEDLEDNYKVFVEELTKNGYQKKIITAMIGNYQQRLKVLEDALKQIEYIKNTNTLDDEIFI